MGVNVYASATEDGSDGNSGQGGNSAVTIDCPDVGDKLTTVPDQASAEVDGELAQLDEQIAAAYRQLQESAESVRQDADFADNAVMNPLKEKRGATIQRIAEAIDRAGDRPEGLEDLAACTLRANDDQADEGADGNGDENQNGDQAGDDQNGGGDQQGDEGQQGNGGQAGNGPVAADYADINAVQPTQQTPDPSSGPSRGTFATSCGVNANGLFNSDNVIVAPGVTNGAHHFHDYVGNQSNDAFASDDDLANADTSCVDQGDKSTYYWPVLRLQNGNQEQDAQKPGGGIEGNAGEIVTPKEVTLTFVGNPREKVTAMPRLLRVITGDAKAFVNGTANANASWSCTGFEDRQLKDKYPICPSGSDVVRTFRFQSCWDGSNIDSANHRTHVAFAAADGTCPNGFKAVPQLVQRIVYDVDAPSLQDGGKTTPLFAVDSFPEQLHKPVTDHGDFINVFDEDLMGEMVDCINDGRTCGAGTDPGSDDGAGNGDGNNGGNNGGAGNGDDNGGVGNGDDNGSGDDGNAGNGNGNAGNGDDNGSDEGTQEPSQAPEAPATTEPADNTEPDAGDNGSGGAAVTTDPRVYTKPSAKAATSAPAAGSGGEIGSPATAAPAATPEQSQTPAGTGADTTIPGGTEPQAVQGGLAETGANLWPAAAGGLLVIAGFGVLFRNARRKY
ncbi:DUF1996 domain-containing protein [Streptomyces asoensis]|uniref:DUF1996 domain-containing protein n=1 Tax=Streptomyces asoensis TaxID=249586 RepID=A0A6M4X629_9ACTN|nr:DUF1996 domain-containing protein [Streptomyces asoensis]QJT07321.1 DUF1996 domain-containing protein [Streptomyces asoensis]